MRIKTVTRRDAVQLQTDMWYSLYAGKNPDYDDEGLEELEYTASRDNPVSFVGCLSAGNSDGYEQPFGVDVKYDRIITTKDITLPITETTLLWIDTKPVDDEGNFLSPLPEADYVVVARPLKSKNALRIAIKER